MEKKYYIYKFNKIDGTINVCNYHSYNEPIVFNELEEAKKYVSTRLDFLKTSKSKKKWEFWITEELINSENWDIYFPTKIKK